jgi:nitroreductase
MEFLETLESRRSIRVFSEKGIEKDLVKKILYAATLAPSAGNLQAYKIVLVHTQEAKRDLMIAAMDQECVLQAPVVLVFVADQKTSEIKYEDRGRELYAMQDATIAAAYAQLAAADLGLGSVWIGAFDTLEVSRIIGAGEYEVPVAIIPIGFPAESPETPERKPLEEMYRMI